MQTICIKVWLMAWLLHVIGCLVIFFEGLVKLICLLHKLHRDWSLCRWQDVDTGYMHTVCIKLYHIARLIQVTLCLVIFFQGFIKNLISSCKPIMLWFLIVSKGEKRGSTDNNQSCWCWGLVRSLWLFFEGGCINKHSLTSLILFRMFFPKCLFFRHLLEQLFSAIG